MALNMSIPQVKLTKTLASDLAAACALTPQGLQRIASALERERAVVLKPEVLEKALATEAGSNSKVVMRILLGLAAACRDGSATPTELLDAFSRAVDAREFESPMPDEWRACRPHIEKLICSRSVTMLAKALDLTYDFGQIYVASRILTDIRPVFDDARQMIHGSAISQVLRLEYVTREGDRSSLTLLMDNRDIEQMRKSCETALRKFTVAKDLMEKAVGRDTTLSGEDLQ